MANNEQPRRVCATCDWWERERPSGNATGNMGECRRKPPHVDGSWPQTFDTEWCGEWQPRRKDRGGDHD
jgi:hypothetical protein